LYAWVIYLNSIDVASELQVTSAVAAFVNLKFRFLFDELRVG